jgi:hypothetical protein
MTDPVLRTLLWFVVFVGLFGAFSLWLMMGAPL